MPPTNAGARPVTETETPGTEPAFKLAKAKIALPVPAAMDWLRQTHGISYARQLSAMVRLAASPARLRPEDYFLYALFRPELSDDARRAFLSLGRVARLNARLSPRDAAGAQHGLLADKLLAGLLFERLGLPVAPIRAVYATRRRVPGHRMLTSADDIAAYLTEPGALPCFGKPTGASLAIGGAGLVALEDDGRAVRLGNGHVVPRDRLAAQIASAFPDGYLFQQFERPAPALARLTGPTIGSLRVATLRLRTGPRVLYAVQNLPAPGAMIDGPTGAEPFGRALVDPETGCILRAQDMTRMGHRTLEASLVTGAPLVGAELPDFAGAIELALEVHRMFPAHGVLGADIVLSDEGPMLNEVNAMPFHSIYQRAADRGLMNPEFQPLIDEAIAVTEAEAPRPVRRWRWPGRR